MQQHSVHEQIQGVGDFPEPLSPDSVAAWVNDLPYGNLALLGSQTLGLLEHLDAKALSASDTLAMVCSLERPVNVILKHLETLVAAEHAESHRLAELGIQFCDRMSAHCERARSVSVGYGAEQRRVVAGTVGLAYIARGAVLAAMVYRAPAAWTWERTGRLCRQFDVEPEKLQNAMLKVIAVWLADCRSLDPRAVLTLAEGMATMNLVPLVLKRGVRADTPGMPFYFQPGVGRPPGVGAVPPGALRMDFSDVVKHIQRQRIFTRKLTAHLAERWGPVTRSKGRRVVCESVITLGAAVGFAAAHRSLYEGSGGRSNRANAFGLDAGQFAQHVARVSVDIMDIAEGGCRLRLAHNEALRIGDVIAVTWLKQEVRVGLVVWMEQDRGTVECGLKWVLANPVAIEVMFEQRHAVPALRGTAVELAGDSSDIVLLYSTPTGSFRSSAWLGEDGGWHRHALAVMEQTQRIELSQAHPLGEPSGAGTARRDKTPQPNIWQLLAPYSGSAAVAPGRLR